MKPLLVAVIPLFLFWACGGGQPSPTSPSPTPLPSATPIVQALRITVPAATLAAGASMQLSAVTVLSDGTTQAVPPDSVRWQVSNLVVAAISTTGVFSARQAGVVDIRGSYQQWTSEAVSVTVGVSDFGWWDY
jgi:Bacterial Ig-like domain (group 2)